MVHCVVIVPVCKKVKEAACVMSNSYFSALKLGWVIGRESSPKKTFTSPIVNGFCFRMPVGAWPHVE